ncbi:MAG TPA: transporter [Cyclobacteriaceae bacterium]
MPRNHNFYIFLILALAQPAVYGQYNETIRSGRPGQSIGPFTVGKGIIQLQTGMDVFGFENKSLNERGDGYLNNTVARFGLTERFEISALVDHRSETDKLNGTETKSQGLAALDFGGRYLVYSGKGAIPSVGFQLRFRLPVLSEDYKIDNVAPRFILATGQKLSETFSLITNWGATWNGINSVATKFYTIDLSFSIVGKLSGFVENYGSTTAGDFDTRFDAGFAYLLTDDLQLDILGGPGSNDGVKDYFISVGISIRNKRKR